MSVATLSDEQIDKLKSEVRNLVFNMNKMSTSEEIVCEVVSELLIKREKRIIEAENVIKNYSPNSVRRYFGFDPVALTEDRSSIL